MGASSIQEKEKRSAHRIELWSRQSLSLPTNNDQCPARIPFHLQSGVVFINPTDVTHLAAHSNYTTIHLISGKSVMISKTLKHCTQCFPRHFLRIHQSYIVNPGFLCEYNSQTSCIEIKSGQVLPVSRSCRAVIKTFIAEQSKEMDS